MATEHNTLTGSSLHEPKGVAAAAVGNIYRANGTGSGSWVIPTPCANFHFTDIATPSTMTLTTAYQKLNDANMSTNMVTDGVSAEITYADGRVTYTGAITRMFHVVSNMSVDHAAGANRDIQFAIYKNGVVINHSEMIMTTSNAIKASSSLHANVSLSTGDYLEMYSLASAGLTMNIYNIYLFMMGMINNNV